MKEPQLRKAFELRRESESGISLTRDDVPNIVVHDLMRIVEDEVSRFKQKKYRDMERENKRMQSRV